MKKILILIALLGLAACKQNVAVRPVAPNEPYTLGECKVYLAVVDGSTVAASPNCQVGVR